MTGWKHDDRTGRFEMQIESEKPMNGARAIFSSRRFWTMLLSIIVGLVLYFVGKYFAAALPNVQFVINLIVPLAIVLIAAFTVDDAIEQIMTTARDARGVIGASIGSGAHHTGAIYATHRITGAGAINKERAVAEANRITGARWVSATLSRSRQSAAASCRRHTSTG